MLIYHTTRWVVRCGLKVFFRKIHISGQDYVPAQGPVLLVANHPNTFMDALLIACFVKRPLHFLARGDAFNNPILAAIFSIFNMLPVYRISEGKENLGKNTGTFDASHELMKKQGTVLIFGEGRCEQNWDLRPLKKGPARIAERAWNDNRSEELTIVPIGLTYEHFDGAGKSVVIAFGKPITKADNTNNETGAAFVKWLNETLSNRLHKLIYYNPSLEPDGTEHSRFIRAWHDAEKSDSGIIQSLQQITLSGGTSTQKRLSAFHQTIIVLPHYWLMQALSKLFTKETAFYDSILFVMVLLLFPFYILTLVYIIVYRI